MNHLQKTLARLRKTQQRLGVRGIARTLLDRLGQKFWGLQVHDILWLDVSWLTDSAAIDLPIDLRVEFRFLTPSEVAVFALDPANDLDETMAERAVGGRDLCFAAVCEGRLANYSWYALDAIEPAHFCGVGLSYPANMAYHYKGFTHPDFRGQRLHGTAMARSLRALGDRYEVTQLISCVHWLNAPSLNSSKRLGFRSLGHMLTTQREQVRLVHVPQAAVQLGVRFGADAVFTHLASQHCDRVPRGFASDCP